MRYEGKIKLLRLADDASGLYDLGRGIVRINPKWMHELGLSRHAVLRITDKATRQSIWVAVRGSNRLAKEQLAMEYDLRAQLAADDDLGTRDLRIDSRGPFAVVPFLWRHPDIVTRMNARLSIGTFALGLVFGFLLGKI